MPTSASLLKDDKARLGLMAGIVFWSMLAKVSWREPRTPISGPEMKQFELENLKFVV